MISLETITFQGDDDGVGWVTLNRPDVYNAFNSKMQDELSALWRSLATDDDVKCIVLTGGGEKAFCTGIDRSEVPATPEDFTFDPDTYEDPGEKLGPRSNGCFTPVIGAVNGMACGGAFYMLGECDILIAADHATFFDPHVTYGMTAVFEPLLLMSKMPYGEVARMTLTGAHERISATRAYEVGLVTEVVPAAELRDAAHRLARDIASQPIGTLRATVEAMWTGRTLGRARAIEMGAQLLAKGTTQEALAEGQRRFSSGDRIDPRTR